MQKPRKKRYLPLGIIFAFFSVYAMCAYSDNTAESTRSINHPAPEAITFASLPLIDQQLFTKLSTLYSIFSEHSGSIWNASYRLDSIPLFLIYRDTQQQHYGYLINHPTALSLPSAKRVTMPAQLTLPSVVKVTEIPRKDALSQMIQFELQFTIAGTPTYVMTYNTSNTDTFGSPSESGWLSYLTHEGLHHTQEGRWGYNDNELQDVRNYPLSQNDISHILLETSALVDAISAQGTHIRLQALHYFVAIRSYRMASHPIVKYMDSTQERYEGTAHYIEHRLKKILPNPSIPDIKILLEIDFSRNTNRRSLAFSRFYATGAALSMLLDRLDLDWKPMLESGLSQYDILHQYVKAHPISHTDKQAAHYQQQSWLAEAKARYDYSRLQALATQAVKRVR